jgi:pilus assembly protein CpaD
MASAVAAVDVPISRKVTTAAMVSSLINAGVRRRSMHTVRTMLTGRRGSAAAALRAAIVTGFGLLVCACQTDQKITAAPDVPYDYRLRHPITVTEAERTLQFFIGANRGELTAEQRAELLAFAQNWKQEATGGVLIDLPTGTVNEGSAAAALREIRSILAATGVPPKAMMVRNYPANARTLATVRVTYPKITAQAGPCGMWPEDIGPSYNRDYFENQPHWNFGCANQRNLAAMVENPSDLVHPQHETPPYNMRRTKVMEKYRDGESTATQYPNANAAKISDFGQ